MEAENNIIKENDIYGKNISDVMALAVKSLGGIVPYLGPALGEIVSFIIPNQRIDRIAKYLYQINEKVNELFEEIKSDREKLNLIETGLKSSANSIFDEKCEWLANIVIHGISDDIEISIADSIINIVSQLNYEQIIILYYHVYYDNKPLTEEKRMFLKRFENLFNYGKYISDDREKFTLLKNKEKMNITTLVNLGLLENDFKIAKLSSFGVSSSGSNFNTDIKMLQKQLYELNQNIIDSYRSERYNSTKLGNLVIKTMNLGETAF